MAKVPGRRRTPKARRRDPTPGLGLKPLVAGLSRAQHGIAPRDAAVVFFDADAELCTRRVAARVGHPTIPTGTGRKAVEHFRKRLVPPNAAEGFRAIYIVGSAGDSSALVYQLGGA